MSTYTSLKGFTYVGETLITNQLGVNLEQYLNWGLLNKGGFVNIQSTTSGAYGGSTLNVLRPIKHRGYTDGRVWAGYRDDWVWESGVEFSTQPIGISGVTVNNVFYHKSTTGSSGFIIDYKAGLVIFNAAIATSSVVECNYSTRWVSVYTPSKASWFQQIQNNPERIDTSYFRQFGSGDRSVLPDNKIDLPAVVIEIVPNRQLPKGLGLGGGQYLYQDVIYHIYTNTEWERNQIFDIISYQNRKRIHMFDVDLVDNAGAWLNQYGDIANNTKTYADWVKPTGDGGYQLGSKKLTFYDMRGGEWYRPQQGLWSATVIATIELDMPTL